MILKMGALKNSQPRLEQEDEHFQNKKGWGPIDLIFFNHYLLIFKTGMIIVSTREGGCEDDLKYM